MLSVSLAIIFGTFCTIMFGVLAFCLRERKRALASQLPDAQRDQEADNRVAVTLFGAIVAGAVLALITAYAVFFRNWN